MFYAATLFYYILLVLMFFVEVPSYLPIVVGIFVFIFILIELLKNKKLKHTVSSFVFASLVSGFILIALGILQSTIVGVDTTEVLSYKTFKLYALLSVFVNEIFIERLKFRNAKWIYLKGFLIWMLWLKIELLNFEKSSGFLSKSSLKRSTWNAGPLWLMRRARSARLSRPPTRFAKFWGEI